MPNNGVYVTNIPFKEFSNLRSYIRDNTTALFLEIPANPFLRVVDLSSAVSVAKESGITTIVDSTFASPLNIKPLDFGADLVLHSGTKYLGGHHDLSTGVVAGSYERLSLINRYRNLLGSNVRPLDSFLLSRSLYTFEMTMQCRNKSALEIARYLEKHPKIKRVWYPGCKSHPDYELAKAQMVGFGGVIPFELNANEEQTRIFVDSLSIPYLAHNFGGCTSTVEPHVLFTHYGNREEAQRRGLGGNLIRYSVGFEKASDLIADLENTLKSF
jgi:cystathionine beta-lyase/cystathionine gamma-synthase